MCFDERHRQQYGTLSAEATTDEKSLDKVGSFLEGEGWIAHTAVDPELLGFCSHFVQGKAMAIAGDNWLRLLFRRLPMPLLESAMSLERNLFRRIFDDVA